VSRFNRELQLTLQSAMREAMARRNPYLTVEHLLYALLHDSRGAEVLRHVGADLADLKEELRQFLDEDLDSEPGTEPLETGQTLAFHRAIQAAIAHAENAERDEVEAGDLIAALFQDPDTHAVALLRAQGVSRLDVLKYISHGISRLTGQEPSRSSGPASQPGRRSEGPSEGEDATGDPLRAFATNLTELAREGKLDPLVGRQAEIERAIHVLARRRKNNPIFVGESGVGKTAIAEGLAQRIASGDVPDHLEGAEIFALDLGSMLAGTKYRGDFEARFKALVAAVKERTRPIVFIDEIHTILGAGSAQGATVDASNMLKPLLQTGELRCMGSTTYAEYRHFESDRALARRFQKIEVTEPSLEESGKILAGLAPRYEKHHGVRYSQRSLRAAVDLSARHLHDRFLPDKAIDVMDEAGAAVRLRKGGRKTVSVHDVEEIVAKMARIPLPTASTSDRVQLESLESDLRKAVFGQDGAIATVVRAVKRARAGLGGADKPIGSFLFAGPTGVGKTELARQLASALRVPFLRFDMSEYMEKHAVARLIGAPPGYVGYDQGGILVDAVRKNPHAVLLLDEIEKAHPDLFDILLQVMDRATLTDNHGREASFRHVTLVMTSNAGAREMSARAIGFGASMRGDGSKEIERLFSPEFRNRLDEIVHFHALTPEVMGRVVDKFVREVEGQLREKKVRITLTPAARAWLAERGYDPLFGARPLGRVIQTRIKDALADEILFGRLARGGTARVDVTSSGEELAFTFESRERVKAHA
jgi:ATP-dependent Clp protease ATP-binding subunit ClpA